MYKFKKGDEVIIITGKDKGKRGVINKVIMEKGIPDRLIVEGIKKVYKHKKVNRETGEGGIVSKESSIHVSNVSHIDTNGKPARVGFKIIDGEKVRYLKSTDQIIN